VLEAALDAVSLTGAVKVPRMTTGARQWCGLPCAPGVALLTIRKHWSGMVR
jgi:hypothetical protein